MSHFVATGNGVNSGGTILCSNPTNHHPFIPLRPRKTAVPVTTRRALRFKVSAKKLSPAGRFDGKNRRSSTKIRDEETEGNYIGKGTNDVESSAGAESYSSSASAGVDGTADGYFLPDLPGNEPDFWEGEKWDVFGFVMQYLWAFGVVFALIACGIAVATYNEGATDFKDTPAYKASQESQQFLEEPEASNSDVFESNPTEVAPSLE